MDDIVKRRRFSLYGEGQEPSFKFESDVKDIQSDDFGRQPSSEKGAGNQRAAQAALQSIQSGGSVTDVGASALMASGNPVALGAGAGLAVLSSARKAKNKQEDQRYMREQDRINRQQQALNRLVDISTGLRRL